MGEHIVRFVFETLIWASCYYTSRLLLPVVSLGRLYVRPLNSSRYPATGGGTGKLAVGPEFAFILGLIFWLFAGAVLYGILKPHE